MGKASNAKKSRAEVIAGSGYGKKSVNWFPIVTTIVAVVAVLALGAVTFFANQKAAEPSVAPSSNVNVPADIATTVDQETGGITIGTASNNLEEYVDFGCPFCGDYYRTNGETIKGFVADGDLSLSIHPLGMLDNSFQGTKYSTRSANALYCIVENDPNSIFDFVANMYENQPKEGTSGLTDDEILTIARNAGATNSESCISDGTYNGFVTEKTKTALSQEWFKGTPAIRLNGEIVQSANAVDAVRAAIGS